MTQRAKETTVKCSSCGHANCFNQPYRYHAGFGNSGFLYYDEGNRTLVWSSFDPAFQAVVGDKHKHPWSLSRFEQAALENGLAPAPFGGRFRFANPARCTECGAAISGPMLEDIYYVIYTNSIDADAHLVRRH